MSEILHIHAEPEREYAFPPEEENLLLEIAQRVDELPAPNVDDIEILKKIDEVSRIPNILERLGDSAPMLTPDTYAKLVLAFADGYDDLPTSHPRYDHQHADGEHSCGKIHGPLRRRLDGFESWAVKKISNERAAALATAAFRMSALAFCPGDDLFAIGMNVGGAISGKMDGVEKHQEELATLRRRPHLDFRVDGKHVIAQLPMDSTVSHDEMGTAHIGRMIVKDTRNLQDAAREQRIQEHLDKQPERHRRRVRIAATAGSIAILAFGIGESSTPQASLHARMPISSNH